MITYSTNQNTPAVIRNLVRTPPLRIVLETDAPYMVPGNIYKSLPGLKSGSRLPLCHTAMIPWTAAFVADVANEVGKDAEVAERDANVDHSPDGDRLYDVERVMQEARENARRVYGV